MILLGFSFFEQYFEKGYELRFGDKNTPAPPSPRVVTQNDNENMK
jgi:hypothetical protein